MEEDRKDEENETSESYRKVDTRAGREEAEGSPVEPAPPAEASEEQAEEPDQSAETSVEDEETVPRMDTYGLLRLSLGMFAEQAWVEMGVQLAPGAKELTTDLHQAKLAIDTVSFLK